MYLFICIYILYSLLGEEEESPEVTMGLNDSIWFIIIFVVTDVTKCVGVRLCMV